MKLYRLLIIGDEGVGKTSYIKKFTKNFFEDECIPTIIFDVFDLKFGVDSKEIILKVFDFSGKIKYGDPSCSYYICADCAIIMFDETNEQSFDNINVWYKNIINKHGNIPIAICCNKHDIGTEQSISNKKINSLRSLVNKYNYKVGIFPTSTKVDDDYVTQPFLYLLNELNNK